MSLTKKELVALLRKELEDQGFSLRGFRVEAHVYENAATFEADGGSYDNALADFESWSDAIKRAAPGRVFDFFIYEKPAFGWGSHDLITNVVAELPKDGAP